VGIFDRAGKCGRQRVLIAICRRLRRLAGRFGIALTHAPGLYADTRFAGFSIQFEKEVAFSNSLNLKLHFKPITD